MRRDSRVPYTRTTSRPPPSQPHTSLSRSIGRARTEKRRVCFVLSCVIQQLRGDDTRYSRNRIFSVSSPQLDGFVIARILGRVAVERGDCRTRPATAAAAARSPASASADPPLQQVQRGEGLAAGRPGGGGGSWRSARWPGRRRRSRHCSLGAGGPQQLWARRCGGEGEMRVR